MNKEKIDSRLTQIISTLGVGDRFECLVRTANQQSYEKVCTKFGNRVQGKFPFINSFSARLTKKEISSLSQSGNIAFISSVMSVYSLMYVAKKILHIPKYHYGEGQTICVIDTGIRPHCDFFMCKNRLLKFVDLINGEMDCYDDNGHGTFVAGVCAGSGVMSGGRFSGIAPKANIISIKALNKKGEADSQKILEAMQWVYDNKEKYGISIVCMSYGSDPIGLSDPIMLGADKLWDSGLVVVAAAGNSGPEYQTIKSPGVSRKVITVGGFNDNRYDDEDFNPNFFEMASFSSRGPCYRYFKPDVVAPAVDITSCGKDKDYVTLSGTSVATPMIAGMCALIKEKEPTLSPNGVKNRLLSVCKPMFFNRNFEGYGVPQLDLRF